MYVEISGRQSGKSTRLADHASDELIDNIGDGHHTICVVCYNRFSGGRIRDLILERFFDKLHNMEHPQYVDICGRLESDNPHGDSNVRRVREKILIQHDMNQPNGGHIDKFYVDEFAFIYDELDVNIEAYYCTTPNGDDNFTRRIINFCQAYNVDIVSYDMSEGIRHDLGQTYYVEEFDNWCHNHNIYPRRPPFAPTTEGQRLNNNLIPKGVKRHIF